MNHKNKFKVHLNTMGNESLVTRARNTLVSQFLDYCEKDDKSFTHLMFIDADIGFNGEAVTRLLQSDYDPNFQDVDGNTGLIISSMNDNYDIVKLLLDLNPDIRILGSDYKGKSFTGDDLYIEIHYHKRNHNYSTTNLREKIEALVSYQSVRSIH